jgi:hypothetical protein
LPVASEKIVVDCHLSMVNGIIGMRKYTNIALQDQTPFTFIASGKKLILGIWADLETAPTMYVEMWKGMYNV